MEEMVLEERPGLFGKLANIFTRENAGDEEYEETETPQGKALTIKQAYRYTVTVRRHITSFDDAMAAATGLRNGEQQILNLSTADPAIRQKIVDFMCGVNFAQDGTWEEIGENIYLIAPANAYVEVAPTTPRINALKN